VDSDTSLAIRAVCTIMLLRLPAHHTWALALVGGQDIDGLFGIPTTDFRSMCDIIATTVYRYIMIEHRLYPRYHKAIVNPSRLLGTRHFQNRIP